MKDSFYTASKVLTAQCLTSKEMSILPPLLL
ncbi:hypothetical protein MTATph1_CDS0156 [Moorella phage MTATph1]